jgi:gas vesicle protein
MHGEHLLDRVEERTAKLNRVPGAVLNILLGVCIGMLAAYAIHFQRPMVEFEIIGPLMGGAGGALASLFSRDRSGRKREEKLRLERLEAASRLQMALQMVDFLRSQGRLLPEDVKLGAWTEVNRLLSNQKITASARPQTALLGTLLPSSDS